jgi:hypothetical protein
MANLDNSLRRIKRQLSGPMISIPQLDGSVARFRQTDLAAAYLAANAREGGLTRDDHPLCRAARTSSDPTWRDSVYAGPADEDIPEEPLEDLSEPVGGE